MAKRNGQVTRFFAILDLLQNNRYGISTRDIFEKIKDLDHDVSSIRTIYRDLEAIQDSGQPLTKTANGKRDTDAALWILEGTVKLNQHLALTYRELVSLYLARKALIPLKDSPLYEDLEGAFNKIEAKLGPKAQEHLLELAGDFHFEAGPKWGLGLDLETLETVRASCAERQILLCTYKSVNTQTTTQRHLGPHYLYFSKGSIYLVAEDLLEHKVKVFSLARMTECEMQDEVYEGVITDPEVFFKNSFGIFSGSAAVNVTLEFSNLVGPFIKERKWHSSQRIVAKTAGSIECHLECAISPELVQWVLGFGSDVKVIEPQELVEQIKSKAEKVLAQYQKKAA